MAKTEYKCNSCENHHSVLMFEILEGCGLICRYCLFDATGYNSVAEYWKDYHLDPEKKLDET